MVLTPSHPKGRKVRLCTGGAVTFLTSFVPTDLYEDDLKYGNRDIALGSLVFFRSKDERAGWRTTT